MFANDHPLATLLVRLEHLKLYHAGPQLTLAEFRLKFWIVGSRNLARKWIQQCMNCFRVKPETLIPLMGNLSSNRNRLEPCFPVLNTGTDYAGPFIVKENLGRSQKTCEKV